MTRPACLLAMTLGFAVCGCGVQSSHKKMRADCDAIKAMADIKLRMDRLDRKIQDLRPSTVTLESVRRLAPVYRNAASTYDELSTKATTRLARARSTGRPSDLTRAWSLLIESLKIRRAGMQFFADAFAHPEAFNRALVAKGQTYQRRTVQFNSRFQSRLTRLLSARGFEQRSDGQFVIDC